MAGSRFDTSSATLLPSGEVLGVSSQGAEVFDPQTETWREVVGPAPPMGYHTATLLSTGKVLFVSGRNTQLYEPVSGRWSRAALPLEPDRTEFNSVQLSDGRVLVAGGGNIEAVGTEIYDPRTNTWAATGQIVRGVSRFGLLVFLSNGEVLSLSRGQTQIYSPTTGRWRPSIPVAWSSSFTLTALPNGLALLTGGSEAGKATLLFDVGAGVAATTGPDQQFRGTLDAGYYSAVVRLRPGANPGFWGVEILPSGGVLSGGFNFGTGLDRSGRLASIT